MLHVSSSVRVAQRRNPLRGNQCVKSYWLANRPSYSTGISAMSHRLQLTIDADCNGMQ